MRSQSSVLTTVAALTVSSLLTPGDVRAATVTFDPTTSTSQTNAPGDGSYPYPYAGALSVYLLDVGVTDNWAGATTYAAGDDMVFNQASGQFNLQVDSTVPAAAPASVTFDGGANYVFHRASSTGTSSIGPTRRVGTVSIRRTVSMPSTTRPKTA